MPEVMIEIGERKFEVACNAGEEDYLHAAARLLDEEAAILAGQIGRIPEARMLLMAGLMLADKTAGLEDRLREADAEAAKLRAQIEMLESRPTPAAERIEVPVVPAEVTETLAEIAARAEALADQVETRSE